MAVFPITLDIMADQVASNLEISRPNKRHKETDLLRYINLAIIEVAKRTRAIQVTKFLFLSANVARYTLPTDSLRGQVSQVLFLETGSLSGAQYTFKKADRRGFQAITPLALSGILSTVAYSQPGHGAPTHYLLDGPVIEFRPIPTSSHAGANRICYKGPGIPDLVLAPTSIPDMAVEHRILVIEYATHLGQLKDKDIRASETLNNFKNECEQVNADVKWADQEEPPAMQPEDWYESSEWSIN